MLKEGNLAGRGGPSGKGGQKRENPIRSGDITCMNLAINI